MFFDILHTKSFRIFCFLLILACAVLQMRFSIQEQKSFSNKADGDSPVHSRNPRILTFHAKQKHMFEAEMGAATLLLQKALISNPYYVPAWLALAELNNDLGNKQKASAILQYVDELTRDLKQWRWDKTLVAYQLGRVDMLPAELNYIVREIPGKNRNDALQLAFTLWGEPEELLLNLGRENILYLFDYAVRKKVPQKALVFWQIMEDGGAPWQEIQALAFLDMLLQTDEIVEAGNIWRKHFNPETIIYNGDFSQPFLQRAFGWRDGKDKGFEQRFVHNSGEDSITSLHYRFKGWDNLDFYHLYQIVPIASGKRYTLEAEFKSQKLTTDQRPFLEVYGYKCKGLYAKSEMITPDQDWQQHKVVFDVPEECAAVVIRLRRNESRQIDNKLAGQLWLRNLVVTETGEDFTVLDQLP